jgi:hypothetical protein
MSNRSPASILYDENGNPVGVMFDGSVYRLQVEALISNADGVSADIEQLGTRNALAVEYPKLYMLQEEILGELIKIRKHLSSITEEEWDGERDD